jgi:hypothetical protein
MSFHDIGSDHLNFASMLPTGALRDGANELDVYEVSRSGSGLGLVPLGSADGP